MDDLDGTDSQQLSVPVPKIDMEPLASDRAADGTKTRIGIAAAPPPRRPAASAPPPIPTAAFPLASPADMTPPNASDSVDVPIDIDDAEPSATLHGQGAPAVHVLKVVTPDAVPADSSAANSAEMAASAVTAAADEPRAPTASEAALPPLPTASREWMRASSQVIAPVPHAPRAMPPAPRPSLRGNTPPRGARTMLTPASNAVPVTTSAAGTQPNPMVAAPMPAPMPVAQPMPTQPMPVEPMFVAQPMPAQPMPAVPPMPGQPMPVVQPMPAQPMPSAQMPVATPRPSHAALPAPNPFEDEVVPTTYFERAAAPRPWNGKMLAGIGLAAVAGVSILALALRGGDSKPSSNDSTATAQQEVTPHKRSHKRVASADVEAPTKHDSDDGVGVKHDDDTDGAKHDTDVANSGGAANHAADLDTAPEAPSAHASDEGPTAHTDTTARGDHAMAHVEIPISTWPAGALVTLVDNGTTTVLGKTPLIASLDPSRSYDIVLALKDRPTTVKHLDPRTTHNLAVDFDDKHRSSTTETARTEPARATTQPSTSKQSGSRTSPAPRITQTSVAQSAYGQVAAPAPNAPAAPRTGTPAVGTGTNPGTAPNAPAKAAPAPAPQAVAKAAPATQAPAVAPPPPPKKNPKLEALTAAPEASAEITGSLAITSTPACEIVVDGKPTRLSTPQRTLALSPGSHVITLVNANENIRKSFAVKIEAKHTTSLSHDFTH